MISPPDVFGPQVVKDIFRMVDGTLVIRVELEFLLLNSQLSDELLHPDYFPAGFHCSHILSFRGRRPCATWTNTKQLPLHKSSRIQKWIGWYLHQTKCLNQCNLSIGVYLSRIEDTRSRCLSGTEVSTWQQPNALFRGYSYIGWLRQCIQCPAWCKQLHTSSFRLRRHKGILSSRPSRFFILHIDFYLSCSLSVVSSGPVSHFPCRIFGAPLSHNFLLTTITISLFVPEQRASLGFVFTDPYLSSRTT